MLEVMDRLIDSSRENVLKKEVIIDGMSDFLKEGNRFGRPPFGYDHYGPRVVKEGFLRKTQNIQINEQGRLLKECFQLKLTGLYTDTQIIEMLKPRGLKISRQRMSAIWRKPFY